MKYSVAQNNAINNIVACFQLQNVYMIFALFIDTARVLKSSILFKIKRENIIYLANSVM